METAEVTEHVTKSSVTTEIGTNSTEEEDSGNVQVKAEQVRSFRSRPDTSKNRGGTRFFGLLERFAAALANTFHGSGWKISVPPPAETNPKMKMAIRLYHCIESGSAYEHPADTFMGRPGCQRY